ncbi:MAG: hypothetical protein HY347_06135 [candidate division NC10 bacterium]|nr:hypothetical protein [candidate division NC10 bacterium]
MANIAEGTARIVEELIPEGDFDEKVRQLLFSEIRRRLTTFEMIDRRMRQKYGMNLEEFEARQIVKERGFSFEVESDYHEWDQAIDAIQALRENLRKLTAK